MKIQNTDEINGNRLKWKQKKIKMEQERLSAACRRGTSHRQVQTMKMHGKSMQKTKKKKKYLFWIIHMASANIDDQWYFHSITCLRRFDLTSVSAGIYDLLWTILKE